MKRDRPALTVPEKDPGMTARMTRMKKKNRKKKTGRRKPGDLKIDLDDQREELKRISAEINHISDGLKEPEKKVRTLKNRAKAMTVKTPAIPIRITERIPRRRKNGRRHKEEQPASDNTGDQEPKPSRPRQPLKTSLRLLMSRRTIQTILKGTAARTYLRQKKG